MAINSIFSPGFFGPPSFESEFGQGEAARVRSLQAGLKKQKQEAGTPKLPQGVFSPTVDPGFSSRLEDVVASINRPQPSFQDILSEGINSPLLQMILQPALASLRPGADRARQALTDRFRAAGGLRSGAYGVSAADLESQLLGEESDLISKVLASFLPAVAGGLQNEAGRNLQQSGLLAQILGLSAPSPTPAFGRTGPVITGGAVPGGPVPFITPSQVGMSAPPPQQQMSPILQALLDMQLSPDSFGDDSFGGAFDTPLLDF